MKRRIFGYDFVITIVFGLIAAVLMVFAMIEMGRSLDMAVAGDAARLLRHAGYSLLAILLNLFFSYLHTKALMVYQGNFALKLREDMVGSLYTEPTSSFIQNKPDYYLNTLNEDVDMVRLSYAYNIPAVIIEISQVLATSIALLVLNAWFLLVALVLTILPVIVGKLFIAPLSKAQKERSNANEQFLHQTQEMIWGYHAIKGSGNCRNFMKRFGASNSEKNSATITYNILGFMSGKCAWTISSISQVLIVLLGGFLIIRGEFTPGLLISAIALISNITGGAGNIAEYISKIIASKPLLRKIEGILGRDNKAEGRLGSVSADVDMKDGESTDEEHSAQSLDSGINIKKLTFSHGEDVIFSKVSLHFERNGCYAIIGGSGSGKTTLANLLMKQYEGYEGDISVFGDKLREMDEAGLYGKIGLVAQDTFIFRDTLFNNICMYGAEDLSFQAEYNEILRKVNLVALAQRVGTEALNPEELSGGEKQRIGLARVLARKQDVIVFDEPTSGLDPQNVAIISDIIFSMDDMTRIVISHDWRKAFLERFDSVWEIKQANILHYQV